MRKFKSGTKILKAGIFLAVIGATLFFLNSSESQKADIKSDNINISKFVHLTFDPERGLDALRFSAQDILTLNKEEKSKDYISPVYNLSFESNAISPDWQGQELKDNSVKLFVKLNDSKGWNDWQEVKVEDIDEGKDGTKTDKKFGELFFGNKINAFQYKVSLSKNTDGKPPVIRNVNFSNIDSTKGPKLSPNQGIIKKANASPRIISRAEWGCPEKDYSPDWPPQYQSATHVIIHHTTGDIGYGDTYSQMRAIWHHHRYRTNSDGSVWGDIGYNYVIDGYGNVFEGRFGGENVVGGHAYPYNWGSIGISIMGDYVNHDISDASRSSLTDVMAKKFGDRNLYPTGNRVIEAKNVNGNKVSDYWGRTTPSLNGIIGHRDANPTACPGGAFFNTFGNENWGIRYWTNLQYNQYKSSISISEFSISPSNPSLGETVTVKFKARNLLNASNIVESVGVATRFGEWNEDTGFNNNVTFYPNETKQFEYTKKYWRLGTYSSWISYKQYGIWRNAFSDSGVPGGLNIATHIPNVKVIESLSLNPEYPLADQTPETSFKIHNYDSRPATINAIGVAVRFNGQNRDFVWKPITLDPGAEYTYADSQTFSQVGQYSSWVSTLWPDNNWRNIGADQNKKSDLNFGVYQTPADSKISSSLSISPKYPVKGQTVTASFRVKNFGSQPIRYYRIGVALRGPNDFDLINDFTWRTEVIPGNTEVTLNYSKVINEAGSYFAYLSSCNGSSWSSDLPKTSNDVSLSSNFTVYQTAADPKITSSLNITPQDPVMGQAVTASFEIKNFGDQPIDFKSLGVAVRINNQPQDFTWNAYTLLGGEPKTITLTQNFNSAGNYSAWISAYWPAGYWSSFQTTGTNIQTSANFGVSDFIDKIRISSFSISPTNPVVGEEVTATVGVTNLSNANISINTFGVAVRINPKDGFLPKDFAYTSLNLQANQPTTLTYKQVFNNWAYYETFITYYYGGKWYYPMNNNGVSGMLSFTTHLPDIRITSNIVIDSVSPIMGQTIGGYFTAKSFDSRPVNLTMGIASRYDNQNKDFEWKNITFQPGESKQYSATRTADAVGNHWAWISVHSPLGYWYTPSLADGATISSTQFNVIAHLTTPIVVTGVGGDYAIRNSSGQTLAIKNQWNETSVSYTNGKYYITAPNFALVTNSYIRLEPIGNTVMQINSYYDPNWNSTINYNRFKGTIEIKYSQTSNALWAINDLPMEDYLKGMAETLPSSHQAHLMTMSVAERSYAYYHLVHNGKHPGEPFHLLNSRTVNGVKNGDDQVYVGYGIEEQSSAIRDAVNATSQKVVTYNSLPVVTPYFSRSDGITLSAQDTWRWDWAPWLISVPDPDCNGMTRAGHGVGLSAYGALKRAERGDSYESILQYYYRGTSLGSINNPGIKIGIYKVQY